MSNTIFFKETGSKLKVSNTLLLTQKNAMNIKWTPYSHTGSATRRIPSGDKAFSRFKKEKTPPIN